MVHFCVTKLSWLVMLWRNRHAFYSVMNMKPIEACTHNSLKSNSAICLAKWFISGWQNCPTRNVMTEISCILFRNEYETHLRVEACTDNYNLFAKGLNLYCVQCHIEPSPLGFCYPNHQSESFWIKVINSELDWHRFQTASLYLQLAFTWRILVIYKLYCLSHFKYERDVNTRFSECSALLCTWFQYTCI